MIKTGRNLDVSKSKESNGGWGDTDREAPTKT